VRNRKNRHNIHTQIKKHVTDKLASSSTVIDPVVKDPLKNARAMDSDNRKLGSSRGGDDPEDDPKTKRTGVVDNMSH